MVLKNPPVELSYCLRRGGYIVMVRVARRASGKAFGGQPGCEEGQNEGIASD